MPGRLARSSTFALLALASIGGGGTLAVPDACAAPAVSVATPALSAQPAPGEVNCTVTVGYWRNHPESWIRVTSLTLGTVTYSRGQILAILGAPVAGNALVSLAHQLIAAKLNLLLGAASPAEVTAAIAQADAVIGSLVVPPIGSGMLRPQQTSTIQYLLARFNEGEIGPGHCPDTVTPTRAPTWGALKTIYR